MSDDQQVPHDSPRRGRAIAAARAELDRLRDLALDSDRPDLAERAVAVRARLDSDSVPIAVMGEFKQGKSTLINALLRTDVCPVDPDVGTAVPTVISYGAPARAFGYPDGAARTDPTPLDVSRLAEVVTERQAKPAPRLTSVEVLLDRALLSSGLTLIDTPGLGGLESAHGIAALGVLPLAHAALFVSDASQELTAPELTFLRRILDHCQTVIYVVTKIDLHADWRRVVELDRQHLSEAGLSVPVVAVSSFLRMHALRRADRVLHQQSGFPALLDQLRVRVMRRADRLAAASVSLDVAFLNGQLRQQVAAERDAIGRSPAETGQLVERLEQAATKARRLTTGTANWHVVLGDGIQDLVADIDHDLKQRLLALVRAGEAKLDAADPQQIWPEFEAWVRAEATAAAVANVHTLVERAELLAREVAENFDMEVDALDVDLPVPALRIERLTTLQPNFSSSSSRRLLGLLTAARVSYSGAVVGGAAGSGIVALTTIPALVGAALAPLGAAVPLILVRRLIREDRAREVELRRQLAKQEFRRYVDEVGFVLGKDSRDTVRRTQRHLRDEFTAQAAIVERSSAEALAATRRGAALPPEERRERAQQLDAQWRQLESEATGRRDVADQTA